MFQTKITEMFGIKYPIVVGTMMFLARAEIVAAASNAGALGVLGSAMFQSKEEFRQEIKKLKGMTAKPFAVNLNLFPMRTPVDNREFMEVIYEEGIRIVETSGHKAPEDLAIVVGYENGGATGTLDVTTLCLVPRVVDALKVPVIGGGGVTDGRGFLALLALGAQGVIIGTATLIAEECPIHPKLKQALIEATELDTMVIMRSIQNSHRAWANEAARKVAELEKQQAGLEAIVQTAGGDKVRRMYQEGDIQAGVISCGQGVGLVKKVMPMKDIIEGIVYQADNLRKKLGGI
ncbi:MAG: nitronate monooxygenase [Thermodesulfobacteriota bacterium]